MANLEVRDLTVRFATEQGAVQAVNGVSFDVRAGRTLAIVGESGSGKSSVALAVIGLHDRARTEVTGSVRVGGDELVGASDEALRRLRGAAMAMVFQDPLSSLHPQYPVGRQIAEAYRAHNRCTRRAARARAVDMLGRVGITDPARRADAYPHEFSGGMRQRVMIAMALVNDPALLIADEPTTALDVTVQAQILDLLGDLQREFGSAILLITHDLGVVSEAADEMLVMYGGRVVEQGAVDAVLADPHHPYTWGLLASVPRLTGDPAVRLAPIPGAPPSGLHIPSGCAFHPRCGYAVLGEEGDGPSVREVPVLTPLRREQGHLVACHLDERKRAASFIRDYRRPGLVP
jgi:peptide/nickel transport system ATP-binding protein